RRLPLHRGPERGLPGAAAAGRATADAGARPGPARLVRPAAAPAGRGALRGGVTARGRAPRGSGPGGPVRRGSRSPRRSRPDQARGRPMSTPQTPTAQDPGHGPATAPGAAWADGEHPRYTSPIPVVRTHLGHALASEWTKIRSVRSTMWTLGVFVLLVVGIGTLAGLLVLTRSEEHTSELQSRENLVCRLLLEK